ncbi:unnamed protein product [Pipistrellus nathusii]|uniref:Uncharacterized protein n=1 Tax=Pipistrellus nathusii TaxID=59473 RepID=A0ABN9Z6A0_PIPNA
MCLCVPPSLVPRALHLRRLKCRLRLRQCLIPLCPVLKSFPQECCLCMFILAIYKAASLPTPQVKDKMSLGWIFMGSFSISVLLNFKIHYFGLESLMNWKMV